MDDQAFSLKDFIKQSVSDICEAVEDLRSRYPSVAVDEEATYLGHATRSLIEFDVEVTAAAGSTKDAGGGLELKVAVVSAKAGAKGEETSQSTHASRIKFAVPVYFQHDTIKAQQRKAQKEAEDEAFSRANRQQYTGF